MRLLVGLRYIDSQDEANTLEVRGKLEEPGMIVFLNLYTEPYDFMFLSQQHCLVYLFKPV